MKNNKKGISLIVLVITIIVMIILAASVVITLSNTGIINRANDSVEKIDAKQVEYLASIVWSEEYMNNKRGDVLEKDVLDRLKDYTDEYDITVTDKGVIVVDKNNSEITPDLGPTLGSLVTAADYGAKINYASDNGITDWKVFYHTDEYVYLIASEEIPYNKMPLALSQTGANVSSVSFELEDNTPKEVGWISWGAAPTTARTIQNPKLWMAEWGDYTTNANGRCVSTFLDETIWSGFKNTTATYKDYVVGAIGTPTAEMFVASYSAKRLAEPDSDKLELKLTKNGTIGYYINGSSFTNILSTDSLYVWCTAEYKSSIWLASPTGAYDNGIMIASDRGKITCSGHNNSWTGLRPVVCLRADIPASYGMTTDFEI